MEIFLSRVDVSLFKLILELEGELGFSWGLKFMYIGKVI